MEGNPQNANSTPFLSEQTSNIQANSRNDNVNRNAIQCAPSARKAFTNRDAELSKKIHQAKNALTACEYEAHDSTHVSIDGDDTHTHTHIETHALTSTEYLKAIVFGGLDGIVTIFSIVAGCVGAGLTPLQTITVGVGNLLADAISMGFGEYASAAAEEDYIKAEQEREEWEMENCPEEEKMEMMQIYQYRHGFTKEDAEKYVEIGVKYPSFFISHMMVEELGLMISGDGPSPTQRGIVMFMSFALFGLVPLSTYIGWAVISPSAQFMHEGGAHTLAFFIACVSSALTLFILGFLKGRVTGQKPVMCGFMMLLNGSISGFVAFTVGLGLQNYVGAPPP